MRADKRCQSTPAINHSNCAALTENIASPARGQVNWPRCNRRVHSHTPCASAHTIFKREPDRLRNRYAPPSKPSRANCVCTRTSNRSMPQRRSIGATASHKPVGRSINAVRAAHCTARSHPPQHPRACAHRQTPSRSRRARTRLEMTAHRPAQPAPTTATPAAQSAIGPASNPAKPLPRRCGHTNRADSARFARTTEPASTTTPPLMPCPCRTPRRNARDCGAKCKVGRCVGRRLTVVALAVLLVAVVLFFFKREPHPKAVASLEDSTRLQESDATAVELSGIFEGLLAANVPPPANSQERQARVNGSQSPAMPLPQWDIPVSAYFDQVRSLAEAGNAQAACHLALALTACFRLADAEPTSVALSERRENDENFVEYTSVSTNDQYRPGRERSCVGLHSEQLDQRLTFLTQAADAGVPAAQVVYLEGLAFGLPSNLARHVDELERYHRVAPRYFRNLMESGYVPAVLSWSNLGSSRRLSFLGQVMNLDASWAATFVQLGNLVSDAPVAHSVRNVPPEALEKGTRRAEQIYDLYFAGRQTGKAHEVLDPLAVEECSHEP
jgi:hypothetical protein